MLVDWDLRVDWDLGLDYTIPDLHLPETCLCQDEDTRLRLAWLNRITDSD